jgi:hypothetical protein
MRKPDSETPGWWFSKSRTSGSTTVGIFIYELKSKTHFVLDKGCSLKGVENNEQIKLKW